MKEQPITVYNAQYKLREVRQLYDRLERGLQMLNTEIEKGSVAKCAEIINHFHTLSAQMLHRMEELVLIEQFAINKTRMLIRRDGQLSDGSELTDELIELNPNTLLMLEKLKEVFGSIPHDILEIRES